jgi:hypothetical protein
VQYYSAEVMEGFVAAAEYFDFCGFLGILPRLRSTTLGGAASWQKGLLSGLMNQKVSDS